MFKGFLVLLLFPVVTFANPLFKEESMKVICGKTTDVLEVVAKKYNERLEWSGREAETNGNVLSVWINEQNKTFTIIKTDPSGEVSCVIGAGGPRTST